MAFKIINNNSFRVLGVFANASKKEMVGNKGKFNAFLRVNQPIPDQPFDFSRFLPQVERTLENINKAEGDLAVLKGKIQNSLFWFVKASSVDEECFQRLVEGDMKTAMEKWKTDNSVSSLQNLMVCNLIQGKCREAAVIASNIFDVHFEDWRNMLSFLPDVDGEEVAHLFLDSLYEEMSKELCVMNWNGLPQEWEEYVKKKAITPITNQIDSLVEKCKKSNQDKPIERYHDGYDLLKQAEPLLTELENVLAKEDLMLSAYEDKVYGEMLNCSIASYNEAYDELLKGDEDTFRIVAAECNRLTNKIKTKYLSEVMRKRVLDNKTVINERCKDIQKTIDENLYCGENVCWFCGAHNAKNTLKKDYSYSVNHGSYTTTYTKTVPITLCDACQKELNDQKTWKWLTSLVFFAIGVIIWIFFLDLDLELGEGLGIAIALLIGLSLILGFSTGALFRKWIDGKNIRHFKHTVEQHPLVKYVNSQGYH